MKARATILTGCSAVLVGLMLAASGAGSGSAPPATSFDTSYGGVRILAGDELVRVGPERARDAGVETSRRATKVSYHTTVNFEAVVPGGDELYEIRCPSKRQAVTGGALSATPGLAIANSSRLSPDPDRPTLSGAWYEGVVNLTATTLQWKPLVVCLRG